MRGSPRASSGRAPSLDRDPVARSRGLAGGNTLFERGAAPAALVDRRPPRLGLGESGEDRAPLLLGRLRPDQRLHPRILKGARPSDASYGGMSRRIVTTIFPAGLPAHWPATG